VSRRCERSSAAPEPDRRAPLLKRLSAHADTSLEPDRHMSNTNGALACALLLLTTTTATSAASPQIRPFAADAASTRSVFGQLLELAIDRDALADLTGHDAVRLESFPLPDGYDVDLDLRAFSPLAEHALLLTVGIDGTTTFAAPTMQFYRGTVVGYPDSLAVLWVRAGHAGGSIRLAADETFRFGPRDARLSARERTDHVVVRAATSAGADRAGADGYCAGDALAPIGSDGTTTPATMDDSAERHRVTLAIDATVELHDHLGGIADTAGYVLSLLAEIAAIYDRDLDVELVLGFLRIFAAEPDPYSSGTSSSLTMLSDVRDEWTSNPDLIDVPRATTHLLTHVPGMGGVAYVDVLCNSGYGYSASSIGGSYVDPAVGYSWDIDVVSHELGHNFGSGHTHCYDPEIDRCYNNQTGCYSGLVVPELGSIMSYCHLHKPGKSMIFHERVIAVIRARLDAATCVESVAPARPGAIRADHGGSLQMVKRATGDTGEVTVELTWSEPCNQGDAPGQDFAVYSGTVDRRYADHRPVTCSTGTDTTLSTTVGADDSAYFVVVPQLGGVEGSYGGLPPSLDACAPTTLLTSCAP